MKIQILSITNNTDLRYILRSRLLRFGISLFIVGTVFILWSYFFNYSQWKNKLTQCTSHQRDLQQQIKYLKQKANAVNHYETALDIVQTIENRLSSTITQVSMAEEVNALARNTGVSINASTFKMEQHDDGVRMSHQDIDLRGKYVELRQFLAGLQRLSAMTVPTEIFIQKESAKSNILNTRIHLISYQNQKIN